MAASVRLMINQPMGGQRLLSPAVELSGRRKVDHFCLHSFDSSLDLLAASASASRSRARPGEFGPQLPLETLL